MSYLKLFLHAMLFLLCITFVIKSSFFLIEIKRVNSSSYSYSECKYEKYPIELTGTLVRNLAIQMKPNSLSQDPFYRGIARVYQLILNEEEKKLLICKLINGV